MFIWPRLTLRYGCCRKDPTTKESIDTKAVDTNLLPDRGLANVDSDFVAHNDGARLELIPFNLDEDRPDGNF